MIPKTYAISGMATAVERMLTLLDSVTIIYEQEYRRNRKFC